MGTIPINGVNTIADCAKEALEAARVDVWAWPPPLQSQRVGKRLVEVDVRPLEASALTEPWRDHGPEDGVAPPSSKYAGFDRDAPPTRWCSLDFGKNINLQPHQFNHRSDF